MILGLQIIAILFGLLMAYITFIKFKKGEFKKLDFFFWIVLWIIFIGISIIPQIFDPIVKGLDFSRRLDFFIILGFLFLIGLGFYVYLLAKKNRKKIEDIVRETAFKKNE